MRLARRLLVPPFAIALGLAGSLGLTTTQEAHADSIGSTLNLTYFHQMAVDSADGYVFLSGGVNSVWLLEGTTVSNPAASGVIVTNLAGTYVTTLDAGDGVEGITVDGGKLYAALSSKGAVAAINISTITQSQPTQALYRLPTGDVPYGLTVQSGKLWVSYNGTMGNAGIGDIDLPGGTFTPATAGSSTWYAAPDLYGDPSDTGVLVAAAPDQSPLPIATYNTTTDPATQLSGPAPLGGAGGPTGCGYEAQVSVLPGGKQFAVACQYQTGAQVYSTTDLSAPASTTTGPVTTSPAAVSVAGNGTVAVAAGTVNYDDAYVFAPDGTLLNDISLNNSQGPVTAGLAWSTDGSELFAVIQTGQGGPYAVRVVDAPSLTRPVLTLNGPQSVAIGGTATLSGTLALSTGGALPSDATVTITRTGPSGSSGASWTRPVAANGTFSVADKTLKQLGRYIYTASYASTATTAAATTTFKLSVVKATPTLTLSTGASTALYGSTIKVTAHLGSTHTNRTVSISASFPGSRTVKVLKTATVNSAGNLVVSYPDATRNVVFTVKFGGDAEYAAKSVSVRVGVDARVAMSNSGWYTSASYDGVTYRVFHHTGTLHVAITVTPNKHGECVRMNTQELVNGKWVGGLSQCFALTSASQQVLYMTLASVMYGHWRAQAIFVPSSSDVTNASYYSGWFYFEVVK